MSFSNPWFIFAILSIVGLFKLDVLANLLNISRLRIPEDPEAELSTEEKAGLYNFQGAKLTLLESFVSFVIFLLFWWCGGFAWLDAWIKSFQFHIMIEQLTVIVSLVFAQSLIHLPFSWYDTFVIEERFGFNKTTAVTFWLDRLKGMMLGAILGLPLLAAVIWIFGKLDYAALYAWALFTVVSLLITYLAPRLIMPWFYKFEPLQDSQLKQRIFEMGKKLQFPVQEVYTIDGSKRSSKANAFFTGFGKNKRIALFDTLLSQHSESEILAVLAHEIGHFKRKHIVKQMIFSQLSMGLMFALLQWSFLDPQITRAFEIYQPNVAWQLVAFSLLYSPISSILGWFSSWMSRKYEYEADHYAKEAMGEAESLSAGLKRLTTHHLNHPNPHPLYVFLHYSHPTVEQRLAALNSYGKSEVHT